MSYVALRTGVIIAKFELGQSICSWLVTFLLLIRYVTRLWPWSLSLWPWTFVVSAVMCHVSRVCSLHRMLTKLNSSRRSYCDFSYVQFEHRSPSWIRPEVDFYESSLCGPILYQRQRIKFQHNRLIRGWVIDDSTNFPGPFSGGGETRGQDCRSISQSWGQRPISNLQRW